MCTSSLLDSPTSDVTNASRCLDRSKYTSCKFYVNTEEEKEGLENYSAQQSKKSIKYYAKVNVMAEELTSECGFYELIKTETGFAASCVVLKRVLTPSHADLCSKEWRKCPFNSFNRSST